MTDLILPLKAEYFDAIRAGTKPEEFRLVTPYWQKRLEGRTYDRIVLPKSYPARDDHERRLVRQWRGYRITTLTHPHFGPDPVTVFAIDVAQPEPDGGGEAFSPQFYEALLAHALNALWDRKPFQINSDGAYALIKQAAADRAALATRTPEGQTEGARVDPVLVRQAADRLQGRADKWSLNGDGARIGVRLGDIRIILAALSTSRGEG